MSQDNSRQKTVAIIGTRGYPSYYGGFETAVRRLAPFLADEGWNVVVYGREGSTLSMDSDADSRIESRITRGIDTKALSTLSYGFTASLDAARIKPDVALIMNVANGYWLPFLRMRGIPTLVNVDGIEWERAKWGRIAKAVFRLGAKATALFSTNIVFDARAIGRRWLSEFGREGKFIPYGSVTPVELPIEVGLVHRQYVLLVARFVPENSISEFVQAARLIAESRTVVIVGSSGYGGEVEREVEALDRDFANVKWLGHVSDDKRLLSLWQHAGAYFHGHSVGGTNPALVQAMACGAPIVARDTVYNREVLQDGGIFVEAEGVKIADAIQTLLASSQKQTELSDLASARAAGAYSWGSVCSAYETELSRLMHLARQPSRQVQKAVV